MSEIFTAMMNVIFKHVHGIFLRKFKITCCIHKVMLLGFEALRKFYGSAFGS
jgi:hypothetical protein